MYLIVEVPGINVPTMAKGVPEPERVITLLEALKLPALIFKIPSTVKLPAAEKVVPTWSKVKL